MTRHDLCLCLTTRCIVRCFQEAGCGELSGCIALEQQMPCNLNCPRAIGTEPSKRWAWALDEWPCISSLEPAEATTRLQQQDSGTTLIVSLGVAGFVLVIIMFMCFCTCRYLRTGFGNPINGSFLKQTHWLVLVFGSECYCWCNSISHRVEWLNSKHAFAFRPAIQARSALHVGCELFVYDSLLLVCT